MGHILKYTAGNISEGVMIFRINFDINGHSKLYKMIRRNGWYSRLIETLQSYTDTNINTNKDEIIRVHFELPILMTFTMSTPTHA